MKVTSLLYSIAIVAVIILFISISKLITETNENIPRIEIVRTDTLYYSSGHIICYDILLNEHLYEIKVWDKDSITYAHHKTDCKCFIIDFK